MVPSSRVMRIKQMESKMGLDMYLTGRKFHWATWDAPERDRKEDGLPVQSVEVKLGYWRKHPNLHGYIVQHFAGGLDNCDDVRLSAEQLIELIGAVKERRLPHTEGFFFGKSGDTEEQIAKDVAILEKALAWLEASDEEPIATKTIAEGGGFTLLEVKATERATEQKQKVSREVIYCASW